MKDVRPGYYTLCYSDGTGRNYVTQRSGVLQVTSVTPAPQSFQAQSQVPVTFSLALPPEGTFSGVEQLIWVDGKDNNCQSAYSAPSSLRGSFL